MRPTQIRTLLVVAVALAALTWSGLRILDARMLLVSLPTLPWSVPVALLVLAVGLGMLAVSMRSRLARRRRPARPGEPPARRVDPLLAARAVVLAKASSLGGSVLVGAYVGVALFWLPSAAVAAYRGRVVTAAASAVAALVVVVVALVLERILRLPEDPTSGNEGAGGWGEPGGRSRDAARRIRMVWPIPPRARTLRPWPAPVTAPRAADGGGLRIGIEDVTALRYRDVPERLAPCCSDPALLASGPRP
ncbi:MAG: DUF3180 domain-containing protein [Actinomycetes bacterium]